MAPSTGLGDGGPWSGSAGERGAEHPQASLGWAGNGEGDLPRAPSPPPACCWWPWLELPELGHLVQVTAQRNPRSHRRQTVPATAIPHAERSQQGQPGVAWPKSHPQNLLFPTLQQPERGTASSSWAGAKTSISDQAAARGAAMGRAAAGLTHPVSFPLSCCPRASTGTARSRGPGDTAPQPWGAAGPSDTAGGSLTPSPAVCSSLPGSLGALMGYPRGTPGC